MKLNDSFFKQIASQYVQADGEQLKQELEDLQHNQMAKSSAAFRKRVFRRVNSLRYRRYAIAAGAAAAILLMPLILDAYVKYTRPHVSDIPNYAVSDSAEPGYAGDSAGEIIPLAMELPTGYHLAGVEQDREKTIYYIQNVNLDDIVLTATKANLSESGTAHLEEFEMNGVQVYGIATKDYHLLRFEKDGIVYELTCRYDYNTLVRLGKIILV